MNSTALNIRSAPSTSASSLGVLSKGAAVEAVDASPWRYVTSGGLTGWVHGSYLSNAPVESASAKWRTAGSLLALLRQIDARAPKRKKAYDGTIGDDAHAERKSDHNPDANGVVRALDVTDDPKHGCDVSEIGEALRLSRDARIAYVIHSGRIFSSSLHPWVWRPYSGADPHMHHMHVSVVSDPDLYDDPKPWRIG